MSLLLCCVDRPRFGDPREERYAPNHRIGRLTYRYDVMEAAHTVDSPAARNQTLHYIHFVIILSGHLQVTSVSSFARTVRPISTTVLKLLRIRKETSHSMP